MSRLARGGGESRSAESWIAAGQPNPGAGAYSTRPLARWRGLARGGGESRSAESWIAAGQPNPGAGAYSPRPLARWRGLARGGGDSRPAESWIAAGQPNPGAGAYSPRPLARWRGLVPVLLLLAFGLAWPRGGEPLAFYPVPRMEELCGIAGARPMPRPVRLEIPGYQVVQEAKPPCLTGRYRPWGAPEASRGSGKVAALLERYRKKQDPVREDAELDCGVEIVYFGSRRAAKTRLEERHPGRTPQRFEGFLAAGAITAGNRERLLEIAAGRYLLSLRQTQGCEAQLLEVARQLLEANRAEFSGNQPPAKRTVSLRPKAGRASVPVQARARKRAASATKRRPRVSPAARSPRPPESAPPVRSEPAARRPSRRAASRESASPVRSEPAARQPISVQPEPAARRPSRRAASPESASPVRSEPAAQQPISVQPEPAAQQPSRRPPSPELVPFAATAASTGPQSVATGPAELAFEIPPFLSREPLRVATAAVAAAPRSSAAIPLATDVTAPVPASPAGNPRAIARYEAGRQYQAMERFDDAAQAYATALQLDPRFQPARERLRELEERYGVTPAAQPALPSTTPATVEAPVQPAPAPELPPPPSPVTLPPPVVVEPPPPLAPLTPPVAVTRTQLETRPAVSVVLGLDETRPATSSARGRKARGRRLPILPLAMGGVFTCLMFVLLRKRFGA